MWTHSTRHGEGIELGIWHYIHTSDGTTADGSTSKANTNDSDVRTANSRGKNRGRHLRESAIDVGQANGDIHRERCYQWS